MKEISYCKKTCQELSFYIGYYDNNDLSHSLTRPANTFYLSFPIRKRAEYWYIHGIVGRVKKNLPAGIFYIPNGSNNIHHAFDFYHNTSKYHPIKTAFTQSSINTPVWSDNTDTHRFITNWIKQNKIVLSIDNFYEIPDEYKKEFDICLAECRLRFG